MSGVATVTQVAGSMTVRRRLAEMGVRVGSHVRVLYRTTGGGRVLAVDGARVAVDAHLAAAIQTEPMNA
jgi:Fe2+ transport system protein FeoA